MGRGVAGATTHRVVSIRNDLTRPVCIRGIRVSCGCTKPRLAKKSIEPGEVVPLEIDLTVAAEGLRRSGVVLECVGDGGSPHFELTINLLATVSVGVSLLIPHPVVSVPAILGRPVCADVYVVDYADGSRLPDVTVDSLDAHLEFVRKVTPSRKDAFRGKWLYALVVDRNVPFGKSTLTIRAALPGAVAQTSAAVQIQRERPIRVSPQSLFFGARSRSERAEASVVAVLTPELSGKNLRFTLPSEVSSWVDLSCRPLDDCRWEITAQLRPESLKSPQGSVIVNLEAVGVDMPAVPVPLVWRWID